MKVVSGIKESSEVCARIYEGLHMKNLGDFNYLDNFTGYQITIQDCFVKNISEGNIILRGIVFDDEIYDFVAPAILEKGEVCKIRTTDNYSIVVRDLESILKIIAIDTMDNQYSIECKLNYESNNRIFKTKVEKYEYTYFEFRCVVVNVKLPVLVDEKI